MFERLRYPSRPYPQVLVVAGGSRVLLLLYIASEWELETGSGILLFTVRNIRHLVWLKTEVTILPSDQSLDYVS